MRAGRRRAVGPGGGADGAQGGPRRRFTAVKRGGATPRVARRTSTRNCSSRMSGPGWPTTSRWPRTGHAPTRCPHPGGRRRDRPRARDAPPARGVAGVQLRRARRAPRRRPVPLTDQDRGRDHAAPRALPGSPPRPQQRVRWSPGEAARELVAQARRWAAAHPERTFPRRRPRVARLTRKRQSPPERWGEAWGRRGAASGPLGTSDPHAAEFPTIFKPRAGITFCHVTYIT